MNVQVDLQPEAASPRESPYKTLGGAAYGALQKHYQKSIKHEADVLADEDPENLHQMRVGMRRLRTAIQVFGFALDLPKATSERRIRTFAQTLGQVRDLDVMQLEFTSEIDLPKAEQDTLKRILKRLQHQRSHHFSELKKTLHSDRYDAFKQGFEDWLALPEYEPIAQLSIEQVLPDLLVPLVGQILLHPAWLVGAQAVGKETKFDAITPEFVQQQLIEFGNQLHDLRKQMKRVRYQTELFVEFYDEAYKAQVDEFKHIQEVLGHIQDSVVLQQYLNQHLDDVKAQLPTFSNHLNRHRLDAWQEWRSLQEKYLNSEYRAAVRQQMIG